MSLPNTFIAEVSMLSVASMGKRESIAHRVFGAKASGNTLSRQMLTLSQNDTVDAEDVQDFFWLESAKPVQVSMQMSGGDMQDFICNGFFVWYGSIHAVQVKQINNTDNVVNLLWC